MASSFVKFQTFVGDLGLKVHNLNTDTLNVYLSNTSPNVATHAIKTDLTEISATGGYTAKDTQNTYSQTGGTGSCVGTDVVWTASGGTVGPFRYVVLYNDTSSSPVDPLIGYWDYGSSITLQDGETFTTDFGATMFTIA